MHVCDEESVDIKELISRLSIWKHKKVAHVSCRNVLE